MEYFDIRWHQRLSHYKKALSRLRSAVELSGQRQLTDLEEQGIIQAFEFTHELAWNTLKDFLDSRGEQGLYGSRDVTRVAFRKGLLKDGQTWMNMIKSRNLTSHTYNEEVARAISTAIINEFFPEFEELLETLDKIKNEEPS
jgi:nucleotidyltransferase substrate binding protein (TIGR01987 family)